jgi:hypothetical protein
LACRGELCRAQPLRGMRLLAGLARPTSCCSVSDPSDLAAGCHLDVVSGTSCSCALSQAARTNSQTASIGPAKSKSISAAGRPTLAAMFHGPVSQCPNTGCGAGCRGWRRRAAQSAARRPSGPRFGPGPAGAGSTRRCSRHLAATAQAVPRGIASYWPPRRFWSNCSPAGSLAAVLVTRIARARVGGVRRLDRRVVRSSPCAGRRLGCWR